MCVKGHILKHFCPHRYYTQKPLVKDALVSMGVLAIQVRNDQDIYMNRSALDNTGNRLVGSLISERAKPFGVQIECTKVSLDFN